MKTAIKDYAAGLFYIIAMVAVWSLFFGIQRSHAAANANLVELKACWDAPTQYVDGTPLPPEQLDRYEVEHRSPGGTDTFTVPAPNTGFEQTITQYGEHCYRVRA